MFVPGLSMACPSTSFGAPLKSSSKIRAFALSACAIASSSPVSSLAQTPVGEVSGTAWQHTASSLAATVAQADLVLPARATGTSVWSGKFGNAPATKGERVPVVLFMHGSSGLGLKAIGEWQQWLATLGIASLAPDSFALTGRVTYKSPISVSQYEQIHAMRESEIAPSLLALQSAVWADAGRIVLAGSSEGGVPVARFPGKAFAARMVFSWSCEANYFVAAPRNAFEPDKPVLNVISQTDPFFSRSNTWLGNDAAQGHCGDALKSNPRAAVVLIPGAPHTLLNLPAARHAVAGFMAALARP
jgi:dienelactone hydrolase